MKIYDTPIKDLKIIELAIFSDERGFFTERYQKEKFAEIGINIDFVQDNHSYSKPNVIRGLHYQSFPVAQTKLVSCLSGAVIDVAVDLRKDSATFGRSFSLELSESNGKCLLIPQGFAHGFAVIGDRPAHLFYKVDRYFSKEHDGGIVFNDPHLAINWGVESPIISEKDQKLPRFSEIFTAINQ